VKSILVSKIQNYRQKHGIVMDITMVAKLLWYRLVLQTSSAFFPVLFIYILYNFNYIYIGKHWRCEVNMGWKNARLPPKARYCAGHHDGNKAAVITFSIRNLPSVVPILFSYIVQRHITYALLCLCQISTSITKVGFKEWASVMVRVEIPPKLI